MLTLHPNILEKDGKKEFAIVPYREFLKIQEELEDLRILREAKAEEANSSTISLSSLNKNLAV